MKLRNRFSSGLLLAIVATTTLGASGPAEAPNILLITVDNLGYGDLGCFGSQLIRTPHVDQLAREGVRLRELYCAAPICSPSRGALLTGRYPRRNGLIDVLPTEPQHPPEKGNLSEGLNHREKLLPELLRAAGYKTAAFGKWHIGFAPGSRPTERGFDEYFGNASGNIDYYHHLYAGRPDLYRDTRRVDVAGYSTDLYADAAIDFIRRRARERFFVYLPFNAPCYNGPKNVPPGETVEMWQAPPDVIASYGPGAETDRRRRYAAVITALDRATGRVLAQLARLGLREKTLVIWWSDNGAFLMNENVGRGVASNGALRGGGTTLWEGGIRVPGMVRWPGRITAGTESRQPLIAMDFFALALAAAGVSVPKDRVIDGIDPTGVLTGKGSSSHAALFWDFRAMSAARSGNYKVVREKRDGPWSLYDLSRDVGETENLAKREPVVLSRLQTAFERWYANTGVP